MISAIKHTEQKVIAGGLRGAHLFLQRRGACVWAPRRRRLSS